MHILFKIVEILLLDLWPLSLLVLNHMTAAFTLVLMVISAIYKGQFIIYGDDRVGKSKVPFSFFPNARVKIMPGFGGPSRFVPNFSKPVQFT